MTIEVQVPSVSYVGDGVQDTFDFTFPILQNSHLRVTVEGSLQTEGVDYILITQSGEGGSVVFNPGFIPPDTTIVLIARVTPAGQEVVYTPFDPFPAKTHEGALDKLTMLVQELLRDVGGGGGGGPPIDGEFLPSDPTRTFWDASTRKIKNVVNPIDNQDAATKAYVDFIGGGEGFDPTTDQIISGLWAFTQIINGITSGNLVAADLAPFTRRALTENITGTWTFLDGGNSARKPGARNPRERDVIVNDTPTQADEGAILRVTQIIASITLESLEPQTTFTIFAKASGFTLTEGAGVTISHYDGNGGPPPSGDLNVGRAAALQIQYEDANNVTVYGNGVII